MFKGTFRVAFIYVVEFKLDSAAAALAQIKAKRYWEPYLDKSKPLFLLGIAGFRAKQIEVLVETVQG